MTSSKVSPPAVKPHSRGLDPLPKGDYRLFARIPMERLNPSGAFAKPFPDMGLDADIGAPERPLGCTRGSD
jgi:hypothetical protein